jgi:hypothetical protein
MIKFFLFSVEKDRKIAAVPRSRNFQNFNVVKGTIVGQVPAHDRKLEGRTRTSFNIKYFSDRPRTGPNHKF